MPCLTVSVSIEPTRSKSLAITYTTGRVSGLKRSRAFEEDPDLDTLPFEGAAGPLALSHSHSQHGGSSGEGGAGGGAGGGAQSFEELCGAITAPGNSGVFGRVGSTGLLPGERGFKPSGCGASGAGASGSASGSASASGHTSPLPSSTMATTTTTTGADTDPTTTMSPSSMWCFNESPLFHGTNQGSQPVSPVSPNVLQAVEEIQQGEMDKVYVRGFGRTTLDGAAGYALAGALLQSATGGRPGLGHLGLIGCRITNAGAWALASGIRFNREVGGEGGREGEGAVSRSVGRSVAQSTPQPIITPTSLFSLFPSAMPPHHHRSCASSGSPPVRYLTWVLRL